MIFQVENTWDKAFKSNLSKFYGRQPLKNLLSLLLNTVSNIRRLFSVNQIIIINTVWIA